MASLRIQVDEEDDRYINAEQVEKLSSENAQNTQSTKANLTPTQELVNTVMKQNQEGEEKPQPHSAKANSSPKFILTSEENKGIQEQSEQSSSAAWLQMQPKDTEASGKVNTGSGSSEVGKNKNTHSDKSGRKKGFSQGSRRNFQANQDPRV